ncbi:MAG: hypothetical protein RLZ44_264 [Pseudomonadota bacterium]
MLRPGDLAVDATVGNGHDTLFLANTVGAGGRVIGFDIQPAALAAARARLTAAGLAARVELHLSGHQQLADYLPPGQRLAVAMFNLGYLPGADKACITRPETTAQALTAAWAALRPGGLVSVLVYIGHPGGREELAAVQGWLDAQRDPTLDWHAEQGDAETSPILFLIRRLNKAVQMR